MYKEQFLAVLLLLLSASYSFSSDNLLKNPGLEFNDGQGSKIIDSWELKGGDNHEVWEQEVHSGEYSVKFWWEGTLSQKIPASPGTEYSLSAWLVNSETEPLSEDGSKSAVIKLEFLTGNSEIVGTKTSEPFNGSNPEGKWLKYEIKAPAPPNAVSVRAVFEFLTGKGGGVVCADDLELSISGKRDSSNVEFSKSLQGKWLFKKGDDNTWSKPDFQDNGWSPIVAPGPWEQAYPDYDGFGWYRIHFTVPPEIKGDDLFLLFGRIDDADDTFFNGHLIGSTGRMPPEFLSAWNLTRQYTIPSENINYGGDNVIAVRVYDNMGDGGIIRRPLKLFNTAGLTEYIRQNEQNDLKLGEPLTSDEIKKAKRKLAGNKASRMKMLKLPNGGWTFMTPEGKPFYARGIEYEPLSIYEEFDLEGIKRDIDLIKDAGFNTFTVWCMGFHANQGAGGQHLTIDEMVTLTELARDKGLYIQFYLNLDRFTHLFPKAVLPNGKEHHFDIDYFDPGYRKFIKNFAKRLAYALLPYDNVTTIVPWEEKWAMNETIRQDDEDIYIESFYGSKSGKAAFKKFLTERHSNIKKLNKAWGTSYKTVDEAINESLLQYQEGVRENDRRQYDILEFGTVMLIDYTKDFVSAYKSVDPKMLFQIRNFDLFGPIRTVDPRYSFIDSFGINQYSLGNQGYDITLREEIVKMKLISGVVGKAAYVSNYGFRPLTRDGGTHGLVPDDRIKAQMAADSLALWCFLPEFAGASYAQYIHMGWEGPWEIVEKFTWKPLPIYYSFKAVNALLAKNQERIAVSDYDEKPQVYVFQGLDAFYEIYQRTWLEHTSMSWDLTDMNLNYGVICDNDKFSPAERPVIMANFHVYDKKLDGKTAQKLIDYCAKGGTLVIGNHFGVFDRYLQLNERLKSRLDKLRGIKISVLKKGTLKVTAAKEKYGTPDFEVKNTYYVEGDAATLAPGAEVLLYINVAGKKSPGLIKKKYKKGTVYYFLYNPYLQEFWTDPKIESRTSLASLHFLFSAMGIKHDSEKLGNRGFDLKDGRINVREEEVHHLNNKEFGKLGKYKDEYGEDGERYSGGVITDYFVSFHGRKLNERGWQLNSSENTSIAACVDGNELDFFTTDPVLLNISKDTLKTEQNTEKYKIYQAK
ncbi:MAG: beta galactosidase jelly roll domain-containing protein [Elusimicrobiota bacterium]